MSNKIPPRTSPIVPQSKFKFISFLKIRLFCNSFGDNSNRNSRDVYFGIFYVCNTSNVWRTLTHYMYFTLFKISLNEFAESVASFFQYMFKIIFCMSLSSIKAKRLFLGKDRFYVLYLLDLWSLDSESSIHHLTVFSYSQTNSFLLDWIEVNHFCYS